MSPTVSSTILLSESLTGLALASIIVVGMAGCTSVPTAKATTRQATTFPAVSGPTGPTRLAAPSSQPHARHHPLLMIFASSERDDRLDEQRRQLGPVLVRLAQHRIMVVEVVGDDPLRRAYAVPETGFHLRLVDDDDEIRLQLDDVASSDQISRGLEGMGPR